MPALLMVPQRQRQSLVTSWGPDERRAGVCACGDAVGVGRRTPAALCAGGCPAGAGGCPRLLAAFDAVESHPRVKQYMAGRKQTRL